MSSFNPFTPFKGLSNPELDALHVQLAAEKAIRENATAQSSAKYIWMVPNGQSFDPSEVTDNMKACGYSPHFMPTEKGVCIGVGIGKGICVGVGIGKGFGGFGGGSISKDLPVDPLERLTRFMQNKGFVLLDS